MPLLFVFFSPFPAICILKNYHLHHSHLNNNIDIILERDRGGERKCQRKVEIVCMSIDCWSTKFYGGERENELPNLLQWPQFRKRRRFRLFRRMIVLVKLWRKCLILPLIMQHCLLKVIFPNFLA